MAARFWVGGTGTWDNSTTTHWASSSGGAGGQSVPGSVDTVTFDANSGGGTVTPNYNMTVVSITMGAFTGTLDFSVNNNSPTFATNSGSFNGSGTGIRTLKMGSGTWELQGNLSTEWNMLNTTNLTFDAGTSTIKFTGSTNGNISCAFNSLTYNNVWFARGNSTASITIVGSNTFNDFKDTGTAAHSLLFTTGTTQTVNSFTVSGSVGKLITINSTTTGTHTLSKSSGTVNCQYLNIQHSVATGGATWNATDSTDNNSVATAGSGWIITAPPATGQPSLIRMSTIPYLAGSLRQSNF